MLDRLAAPAALAGDDAKARAFAEESLALFRELGDRPGSLHPLWKVASDEWRRGNRERGVALTEDALTLAREVGDSWWEAGLLGDLADMAWEFEDLPRAAALAGECVSLGHELGNAPTLVYGLALLAALAAAEGKQTRAGRLWGAVEAIEESGEAALSEQDRARYAAVLPPADADFEAARVEGRALTLDEALEYALNRPASG
jgi:hypothetical protein